MSISKININAAEKYLRDILSYAIQYTSQQAVVVSDTQSALAIAMTEAYRRCLPEAVFIDFYASSEDELKAIFEKLAPSSLVVLIQSSNFRLDQFRLRVDLFHQSIKVLEHPRLARMSDDIQSNYYIESLAYDPIYYRGVGKALKQKMDNAKRVVIDSDGERLVFNESLEPAKLNVGDYTGMVNIGGQFPIGEVFTEAKDLESVNGRVRIFAFADIEFLINKPQKPITLVIDKGLVTDVIDTTPEFDLVLEKIRRDEGEVWLRELGFGMNRAFSPERMVCDIGTYERVCGVHLSLGKKHGVYKKPNFKRGTTWHHVDVFAVTHLVYLDDEIVYQDNAWKI